MAMLCAAWCQAAAAGTSHTNPANGHAYYLSDCAVTLPAARALADAKGGHLVAIENAVEQVWLAANFAANGDCWIGLSDAASEGLWQWPDGGATIYFQWAAGQPLNTPADDGVVIQTSGGGGWRVASALELRRAIIEIDHPAVTLDWPVGGITGIEWAACRFFDHGAGTIVNTFGCVPWADDGATALRLDDVRGFAAIDAGGAGVFAAAAGVVVAAVDEYIDRRTDCDHADPPRGNHVDLDHGNGLITRYDHLAAESLLVQAGDAVMAGQQLARIGSSGCSTGPRLAFEARVAGAAVDPFLGECHLSPAVAWRRQPELLTGRIGADTFLSDSCATGGAASPRYYFDPSMTQIGLHAAVRQVRTIGTQVLIEWRQNGVLYATKESPPFAAAACESVIDVCTNRPPTPGPGEVRLLVDGEVSLRLPYVSLGAGESPPADAAPTPALIQFQPAPRAGAPAWIAVVQPSIDPDGALVRYRYKWFVNNVAMREFTTAARTDALAANHMTTDAAVRCEVTPFDGVMIGATTTHSAIVLSNPPVDLDGDGIGDDCDNCPQTGNAPQPDADQDGVGDACDGCPADRFKTEPGNCGCGTPDSPGCTEPCADGDDDGDSVCNAADLCPGANDLLNSDGDALPDCLDGCPNDATKTNAGICGCGVADIDTDGDGAADCLDGCPMDSQKTAPGVCGCGTADADGDGDGTPDCVDGCAMDPLKTAPGVCGCGVAETDSDADGSPNCLDGCPNDPSKTQPGVCGCGRPEQPVCEPCASGDDDGDGVCNDADVCPGQNDSLDGDGDATPDCLDGCPADPAKIAPGVCGCGTSDADADTDGAADCIDGCPLDPHKTAPGICGCGTADADTDGDGTANCVDGCPSDPGKQSPGACGCGVADSDGDGDTAPDCIDGCPADPGKIAPGLCGCGVSDADSDGDLLVDCMDGCPLDPVKTAPGLCGCGQAELPDCGSCVEGDADGDGVCNAVDLCPGKPDGLNSDGDAQPDCLEGCPFDGAKLQPGACGCGAPDADGDGDGAADCIDLCPADSAKTAPGACGCGIIDTPTCGAGCPDGDADGDGVCNAADRCPGQSDRIDFDGDATPDCADGCPLDAGKSAPGACGCGAAEVDADRDAVPDCTDACPFDARKILPGACGCGSLDDDADGDSVADCIDNCPGLANAAQSDDDGDGIGDGCEAVAPPPAASPGIIVRDVTNVRPTAGLCGVGACGAGASMPLLLSGWLVLARRRARP